jgi:uncharacterized repeat protein (TIGR01451 family)
MLLALALLATSAAPAAAADPAPPGCVGSDLQLAVTADKAAVRPDDVIAFTVRATNTSAGACDVTNATVTLRLPSTSGSSTGETKTLTTTGSYTAGTSGALVGTATYKVAVNQGVAALVARANATYTARTGNPDTNDDTHSSASLTVTQPSLELTATPTPAEGIVPLTTTIDYALRNGSSTDVSLSAVTVADGACASVTRTNTDANELLDRGETWRYRCQLTLDREQKVGATVVASGLSNKDARLVSAPNVSWSATATRPPVAHISLTKTADPASGVAPFAFAYTYTVVNDSGPGARPVTDVAIDDPGCGPVTVVTPDDSLAPGERLVFTCPGQLGAAGVISSSAVARGRDSYDGAAIASNVSTAGVAGSLPLQAEPTPIAPGVSPQGVAPIPQPAKPSTTVKFAYTGHFKPARSCKGTVSLTMKAGSKKVATTKVKLDRKCRFKVSITVARTKLGKATKVTVTAKAKGKRSASRRLSVPKT